MSGVNLYADDALDSGRAAWEGIQIPVPITALRHTLVNKARDMNRHVLETMVTDRGTYVRSTDSVRIRKTPELSMTMCRVANLACCRAQRLFA